MATLDQLLSAISPEQIQDTLIAKSNDALNSWKNRTATVHRWNEFRMLLARFYRHVDNELMPYKEPMPLAFDYDWDQCAQILGIIYGKNGFRAAYQISRTGKEKGLYGVLKSVAEQAAIRQAERRVRVMVRTFLDLYSSYESHAAIAEEYIKKHGWMIPSEFREHGISWVVTHLDKILEQHPKNLQKMRLRK